MISYLHSMAECAVGKFNAGRVDELPEHQRMAAGYVPDIIEALTQAGPAPCPTGVGLTVEVDGDFRLILCAIISKKLAQ